MLHDQPAIMPPRSLTDQVYEILEHAILNGEFQPGEDVPEATLAGKLGVSATPIREALNRLTADGLVIKETNKRSRVIMLTEREIQELYDVRTALESLSISTAAEYVSDEDLRELKNIQEKGEEFYRTEQLTAYRNYDREFHNKILSSSRNTLLVEFMGRIQKRIMMCSSITTQIPTIHSQGVREHHEMVELLERSDAEGAKELMRIHIQGAKQLFLQYYQQHNWNAEKRR